MERVCVACYTYLCNHFFVSSVDCEGGSRVIQSCSDMVLAGGLTCFVAEETASTALHGRVFGQAEQRERDARGVELANFWLRMMRTRVVSEKVAHEGRCVVQISNWSKKEGTLRGVDGIVSRAFEYT